MLKEYIFWGIMIAIAIGVIVSQVKRRRRGLSPQSRPLSTRMQFHAHTDADAHDSGAPRLVCIGGSHDGHTLAIPPGGLSVGRAIWRGAVQRNRVRRVFREAFRLSRPALPAGFDFVLIPARPKLEPQLAPTRAELERLTRKLAERWAARRAQAEGAP